MSDMRIAVALFVLLAIPFPVSAQSGETGDSGWHIIETPAGDVRYRSANRSTAERVASHLRAGRARLQWAFPDLWPRYSDRIDWTVRVEPRPTDRAQPGFALTTYEVEEGRLRARTTILALRAHPDGAETKAGQPMDGAYLEKVVLHEYAGLVLDVLYRVDNDDRDVHDEPDWFVQGVQEYLAIRYGPPRARAKTFPAYRNQTTRENLFEDGEIEPDDLYVGGAILVSYLYHRHRPGDVRCIARRDVSSFRRAFRACTGESLAELPERFRMSQARILPACRGPGSTD